MIFKLKDIKLNQVAEKLKKGQIGVLPSDTVYGVFTSALNKKSVEKLYEIRKRDLSKPFIILISKIDDLRLFKIILNSYQKKILNKLWPNPISVVLPCNSPSFLYLHRGTNSLAFRMPKLNWLNEVLDKSGPLVAPSANLSNLPPAENITQAFDYFKEDIDFYIDGGSIKSDPSTIIILNKNSFELIRQGKFTSLEIVS